MRGRVGLAAAGVAGVLLWGGRAEAALTSGQLLTNFASATFSLPSGGSTSIFTEPGKTSFNTVNTETAWVIVTDQPTLCLQLWKQAMDGNVVAPITGAYPGDRVCFVIGFSNCGNYSGFAVTITDVMPAWTRRATNPLSSFWTNAGVLTQSAWATSLGGPWYTSLSPVGQANPPTPHYMRWILRAVGFKKTGYIRYCVTIQ